MLIQLKPHDCDVDCFLKSRRLGLIEQYLLWSLGGRVADSLSMTSEIDGLGIATFKKKRSGCTS